TEGDLLLPVRAWGLPARSGQFVLVAEVSELHDIINADSPVPIIIIVGLPDRAEGIDAGLPVVSKVPAQRLELAPIQIASEDHPLLIRLAVGLHLIARLVDDRISILIPDLFSFVSEVEIELAIRTKMGCVDSVIVVASLN